jgi:hypothetical protein
MGVDFRKNPRIYHKDLIHYKVFLSRGEVDFVEGSLGNISETGLCAIVSKNFEPKVGEELQGYVRYVPLDDRLSIKGRVVWVTEYEHKGTKQIMLGLEFYAPVQFPEHLLALSMSFES